MRRTWVVGAVALLGAAGWWGSSEVSLRTTGVQPQGASPEAPAAARATVANNGFRMVPASTPDRAGAGFASAPDRGDLIAYPARPQVLGDGAYTWHRAGLSERHALAAIASGVLHVTTPSGENLAFRYQRYVEHDSGDWTWIGQIEGEAGKQAIVTFGARAVFGVIDQPGKPSLKLTMRDGASWLVETDPVRLALTGQQSGVHGDDMRLPEAADLPQSGAGAASLPAASAAAVAGTRIDVLVGYSNGFAAGLGGQSQAVTRIANLVDTTNQAYANSQIDARLRLVGTQQVTYTDASANDTALDELTGTRTVPVNAAFNELRAARDRLGADLVSFVRKYDRQNQDGCGVAWIIGGDQRPYTAASAGSGYSVVSDGREQQGSTSYFCREETFAHELGHNLGAQHDRATASSSGTLKYGAFAYSFGYKTSAGGGFYDIMAYGDSGQTAYRVFSNPNVSICNGNPCGVADQADVARTFNQTAPVAATFRDTKVGSGARNDFDGDGRSDVYWRNGASGANDVWFMSGTWMARAATVHVEPDQNWQVVATGDFNGDGRYDVFWRNSATGQTFVHLMDGGRIVASGYSTTVADGNWKVVAVGDFDGDRRTDLYWRNSRTGANDVWLMNGTQPASVSTVHVEPDQNWQVAGAGDFNGDGTADIFWRNLANGQNYVHLMAGTRILGTSGSAPLVADLNYRVAAIGDFNGDGRSDVYWRSSASGECYIWTMNGVQPIAVNLAHNEPDQSWQVANSGDYDGDGRDDIFWRNRSNGQNYIHLLNGPVVKSGGGVYTVSDMNWKIVSR